MQYLPQLFFAKYYMRFNEIANKLPIKPLSPEQARLKSMNDRLKRDQEAIKAERARQQITKAQQNLSAIQRQK